MIGMNKGLKGPLLFCMTDEPIDIKFNDQGISQIINFYGIRGTRYLVYFRKTNEGEEIEGVAIGIKGGEIVFDVFDNLTDLKNYLLIFIKHKEQSKTTSSLS